MKAIPATAVLARVFVMKDKEEKLMLKNWKEMSVINRIAAVVSIVSGVAVIALAAVQLLDVWEGAINIYMPLLGVINLCNAVTEWQRSRRRAYMTLGVAVFIFICSAIVLLG